MKCFLGIDNGGTVTKAAVYDENGRVLSSASESTRVISGRMGFAERDMDEMWRANCRNIRRVISDSGIRPENIAGIACCGHGKGLYLIDKAGRPVRAAILSADTRATGYVKRWRVDGTEQKARTLSLQNVMACQPVALLAWLRDNEPEIIDRIGWLLPCKDYIRFCLTGKAMAERSDMSGTSLMNLNTRDYDSELLELFGIEFIKAALPPLCDTLACCGTVRAEVATETGLLEGTPVYGGMFDIDACAVAVGAVTPKELCMIAGTWSINEFVSEMPMTGGNMRMNSLFCLDGNYLVEESSATSAGNSAWFLQKILGKDPTVEPGLYERLNQAVETIRYDTPLPVYLPFVMASNANPDAQGAFIGMTENMDWRFMLRSVYEGVVFSHRWHLEQLLLLRTEPITEIRFAGGAARSAVWTQMFADVLGYPMQPSGIGEAGTLGCAIAAAVASGLKKDISQAVTDMVHLAAPVMPDPAKKAYYDRRYRLYCDTLRALDSIWSDYRGGNE